jgi:hypothetical protein
LAVRYLQRCRRDGAEKGVLCGRGKLIWIAFQGHCSWLISGVPSGRFWAAGSTGALSERGLSNLSQ